MRSCSLHSPTYIIMREIEICFCICILLTLASNSLCQRIDCHWADQYLCGDKCLGEDNLCVCGNETITLEDAFGYICCNQGTCFKEMDGNVKCHGLKQDWRLPCNKTCKQDAYFGYSTMLCNDQKQCVKPIALCQGTLICNE